VPAKNVYVLHGFGAADLATLDTSEQLWWDINLSPGNGLGGLALAPNGVDPAPVIGRRMGIVTAPQNPWGAITGLLRFQLDPAEWAVTFVPYDWRREFSLVVGQLRDAIFLHSTPESPATIVGHSMGGLVAVLAYKLLEEQGFGNFVRRIITLGTPFQGSYLPVLWLIGALGIVQELTAIYGLVNVIPNVNPLQWELAYLNALALSWPSFYELLPFAQGPDAAADPNRQLLYNAANYPAAIRPDQNWLDYSRDTFQPKLTAAAASVPPWILTAVAGIGCPTARLLSSPTTPLALSKLGIANDGDGVVMESSALTPGAVNFKVSSSHSSLPLGVAASGLLADLIRDTRTPPSPPPPASKLDLTIGTLVTDPPEADDVSPILCIGGG
jgi:pimeloyl-ACP methyl ester carboxylesterase